MVSERSHASSNVGDKVLKRNKALVEQALEEVAVPALVSFAQREMQTKYGANWQQREHLGLSDHHVKAGKLNWQDPQVVLKLMIGQWSAVFQKTATNHGMRRWVSELLDVRNAIKHNELMAFDHDATFRALDSMALLLHQIGADAAHKQVEQQKTAFRQTWQTPATASPTSKGSFHALILEKTEGFIGRDFVFDSIQTFLKTQDNGYFVIEADPGVGKTALLAEYVRRSGYPAYFNVRAQGMNRADQFLDSICRQLIDRYRWSNDVIPSDAVRDGKFFSELLHQASASLKPNERLVIAIDALDEVDTSDHLSGNLLYLPATLPKGIFFVMTQRPIALGLAVNAPLQRFNLMQYGVESRQDITAYIQARVTQSESVQAWMQQQQCNLEDLTMQLAEKSDNNFMYLRYVLREIEQGGYQNASLEGLPQGLGSYYEDHWRRMGMIAKPIPRAKLKIVYVLAELQEPVSRSLISEFAQEDPLTVQAVLDQWREFLREDLIDQQTCYSIYHASFSDFLHRKDIDPANGTNAGTADGLPDRHDPDHSPAIGR
jgi:Swt1-like HEPN